LTGGRKQKLVPPFFCQLNLEPELIVATTGGMQQDLDPPLFKKSLNDYKNFQLMEFDLLPIIE
jgi:hypothetical protein